MARKCEEPYLDEGLFRIERAPNRRDSQQPLTGPPRRDSPHMKPETRRESQPSTSYFANDLYDAVDDNHDEDWSQSTLEKKNTFHPDPDC